EIALQTHEFWNRFGRPQGLESVATIGGVQVSLEERALRDYPRVIIGTPGRICDHLQRGNLWLEFIEVVVLDEADRMLDMGFAQQLTQIMEQLSEKRQTLLFSATISGETEKLARKYLRDPEVISFGSKLMVAET